MHIVYFASKYCNKVIVTRILLPNVDKSCRNIFSFLDYLLLLNLQYLPQYTRVLDFWYTVRLAPWPDIPFSHIIISHWTNQTLPYPNKTERPVHIWQVFGLTWHGIDLITSHLGSSALPTSLSCPSTDWLQKGGTMTSLPIGESNSTPYLSEWTPIIGCSFRHYRLHKGSFTIINIFTSKEYITDFFINIIVVCFGKTRMCSKKTAYLEYNDKSSPQAM